MVVTSALLAVLRPAEVPAMDASSSSWKGLNESSSFPGGSANGVPIPPLVSDSNPTRWSLNADEDNNGKEESAPNAGEEWAIGVLEPPLCCSLPFGVVTSPRPRGRCWRGQGTAAAGVVAAVVLEGSPQGWVHRRDSSAPGHCIVSGTSRFTGGSMRP